MTTPSTRGSSPQPTLAAGVAAFAEILGRSLGPTPRRTLATVGTKTPEFIVDGGTLARRLTELAPRDLNSGAMILRSAVSGVNQSYGDGVATTAVLANAMVAGATRVVTGGAAAVPVRRGIERGVAAACEALSGLATPIDGPDDLSRLALGATHDPQLAELLAEMYDLLGENAWLTVDRMPSPGLDRDYPDGARWRARPADRRLLPPGMTELTVPEPLVVTVDQSLEEVADVVPVLELATDARTPVLLVAREISEPVRELLRTNRAVPGARAVVAAVCPASTPNRRAEDLADIALWCGATIMGDVLGRPPRKLRLEDAGRAEDAVVSGRHLTIRAGAGDTAAISERVADLERHVRTLDRGDSQWRAVRARIARFAGATGVVRVGAQTDAELDLTRERIAKAQRVLELALTEGTVPGGGVAYLQCVPGVVRQRELCAGDDERLGVDIVATALEGPLRQLVANGRVAGTESAPEPDVVLTRIGELGAGWGFDARTGTYAVMAKAGVLDATGVLAGALRAAGGCAGAIVSTAAIVRGKSS